jgi:hypothetical protein
MHIANLRTYARRLPIAISKVLTATRICLPSLMKLLVHFGLCTTSFMP